MIHNTFILLYMPDIKRDTHRLICRSITDKSRYKWYQFYYIETDLV